VLNFTAHLYDTLHLLCEIAARLYVEQCFSSAVRYIINDTDGGSDVLHNPSEILIHAEGDHEQVHKLHSETNSQKTFNCLRSVSRY
jgi:hypothetical protein